MLRGKLINLRTVREEDLEEIFSLTSDFSQTGEHWLIDLPSEIDLRKRYAESGLWSDNFGLMVITDKSNKLLGEINYFKGLWHMPGYEIGYRIYRKEDMGKGYTTEALKIFTAYLFEAKPLKRLELEIIPGNTASRKVAEKCGFTYEGLKRQAVYSRGAYVDIELFSLLKEECPRLKELLL